MKEQARAIYLIVREQVLNPQGFWDSDYFKTESTKDLIKNLFYPIIAAVSVTIFLGEFFRSDYFRLWLGILWIVREIFLIGVLYYGGVFLTNRALDYFGYKQKENHLQILVIYAMLPYLVISIGSGLFPFFRVLDFFGIYGFYIFWLGSKKFLRFPNDKHDNIILKIVAANWIVFLLFSFVTSKLLLLLD